VDTRRGSGRSTWGGGVGGVHGEGEWVEYTWGGEVGGVHGEDMRELPGLRTELIEVGWAY